MCSAHATVRGLLGEIVARTGNGRDIIVDMEAGLEHLSRGTGKHVSRIIAVVEPYFRSLETGRRVKELAQELGVGNVVGLANKVRDEDDRRAIQQFCAAHGLPLVGEIPYDSTLAEAERAGLPPIDSSPAGPAVAAIRDLADTLVAEKGLH
ncbi:MAG: hypothetical protein H0T44_09665 [Gemmatimonadales bacterium]|nr:hypothetical protein [Gemmatimonadales bacterium]